MTSVSVKPADPQRALFTPALRVSGRLAVKRADLPPASQPDAAPARLPQRCMTKPQPDNSLPSFARLRAFFEAIRAGSISKAAEELRRSQSCVTALIQSLEADFGTDLLKRTTTGCYPTEMGKILRDRIGAFFAILESGASMVLQDSSSRGSSPALIVQRITRPQTLAMMALYEHGTFAQAARYSNVSVTSLHRSVRSLEKQIGATLLKNSAQGLTTSELGSKLANRMVLAARELEWAEEEMKAGQGVLRGRLLLGVIVLSGSHFMAVGIDKFIKSHPEVQVSIINSTYDVLLAKLRAGHIDALIGVLKEPAPAEDVVEEPLGDDSYVVVASRSHPLAGKASLAAADLGASEWIGPVSRRPAFERIFQGLPAPRFNVETHSLAALFILLSSANRLAILLRSEVALDKYLGNQLVTLDFRIDQAPIIKGVTVRKQWQPTPVQQAFMSFLRKTGMKEA